MAGGDRVGAGPFTDALTGMSASCLRSRVRGKTWGVFQSMFLSTYRMPGTVLGAVQGAHSSPARKVLSALSTILSGHIQRKGCTGCEGPGLAFLPEL